MQLINNFKTEVLRNYYVRLGNNGFLLYRNANTANILYILQIANPGKSRNYPTSKSN